MGGQGLYIDTADGNNILTGHKTLSYQSINVLRPEL